MWARLRMTDTTKRMRTKGGGFESLEFHPVRVDAAFGVTLAARGNAGEPRRSCLLTWSSAV